MIDNAIVRQNKAGYQRAADSRLDSERAPQTGQRPYCLQTLELNAGTCRDDRDVISVKTSPV